MIKVIRGNPTPEELAAALAVVRARSAAVGAAGAAAREGAAWSDPARTIAHQVLPHPGPTAWRTTYWPT